MSKPMVTEDMWREQVHAAVLVLVSNGEMFTSDDVRALVSEPAPHEGSWSSIWRFPEVRMLVDKAPVPARRSDRKAANGRALTVWRGKPYYLRALKVAA